MCVSVCVCGGVSVCVCVCVCVCVAEMGVELKIMPREGERGMCV